MKKSLNKLVYEDLFRKIQSQYFQVGYKLPTEIEMQEIYKVSRAPIRQALGRLQVEGIVERRPGIGTVVIDSPGLGPWTGRGGFSLSFSQKWKDLYVKTISIEEFVSVEGLVKEFSSIDKESMMKIRRIRTEKNQPIFLVDTYYASHHFEHFKQTKDILNLREFATKHLQLEFCYVREDLKSVISTGDISTLLEISDGTPLLKINRITYDSNFKPVEYVLYYVRSEEWPYRVTYGAEPQL